MERLKGLFVKKREEFEIPRGVETRVTEGSKESRVGGLYAYAKGLVIKRPPPRLISSYESMTDRLGVRVPALRLFSADPYATMDAYSAEGNVPLTLLPNVSYPIVWSPCEHWQHRPMLDETERKIKFQIPLGRTYAVRGIRKSVVTEAWASIPIVQAPWMLSRIGIVGREQFDIDVISADFTTRSELAAKRWEMERLLGATKEKAFRELVDFGRGMPDAQKMYNYNEMMRNLGLGGTRGLLGADDPEALLTRKIEELTRENAELRRSKR